MKERTSGLSEKKCNGNLWLEILLAPAGFLLNSWMSAMPLRCTSAGASMASLCKACVAGTFSNSTGEGQCVTLRVAEC
jgi:hypothetical protein